MRVRMITLGLICLAGFLGSGGCPTGMTHIPQPSMTNVTDPYFSGQYGRDRFIPYEKIVVVSENDDGWKARKYSTNVGGDLYTNSYEMWDPVLHKWYPAIRVGDEIIMSDNGLTLWRKDRMSLPPERRKEKLTSVTTAREKESGDSGDLSSGDLSVDPNDVGGGSCTHLYVLDRSGQEHFLGMTLTAVGEENEKWESRHLNVPVLGDRVVVRFVKEMPRETTYIDQVRLRVEETDQRTGEKTIFYLQGERALKNSSGSNLRTAFLHDGNHIPIKSSAETDSESRWGVRRGESLEMSFKVPAPKDGTRRDYHVMTLGYHVKQPVAEK